MTPLDEAPLAEVERGWLPVVMWALAIAFVGAWIGWGLVEWLGR